MGGRFRGNKMLLSEDPCQIKGIRSVDTMGRL